LKLRKLKTLTYEVLLDGEKGKLRQSLSATQTANQPN